MEKNELQIILKNIVEKFPPKIISIKARKYLKKLKEFTPFLSESSSISERIYCIIHNLNSIPKCPVCNKNCKFHGLKNGYAKHCSKTCINKDLEVRQKITKTCLQKFNSTSPLGNKNIQEKSKKTWIKKYGEDNPSKVEEIKQKKEQTCLKNHDVKNPFQSVKIQEKCKQTWQQNYNVDNPSKSEKIKEKIKNTTIKRHGKDFYKKRVNNLHKILKEKTFENLLKFAEKSFVEPLFTKEEYEGTSYDKLYRWKCKRCEKIFEKYYYSRLIICPDCRKFISNPEKEIFEFLKNELKIDDLHSTVKSIIYPLELDFYSEKYQIAIEFNGLYWHSELNGKNKDYHLNKTLLCKEKGIQLIHIFEDEWITKKEIVKSVLRNKFKKIENKIFARNCIIKEIDSKIKNKFLNENHLQGKDKSIIKLGLFFNDELVSVMTFVKPRFNKNFQWELSRFSNKLNCSVIGGASKLLKFFERNYKPKNLITYADLRYSNGNLYKKLDFKQIGISSPNYFYLKDYAIRISRIQFQKHKLKDKLETFDESLTEWENMQLNGYDRIWDCGNLVFVKEF